MRYVNYILLSNIFHAVLYFYKIKLDYKIVLYCIEKYINFFFKVLNVTNEFLVPQDTNLRKIFIGH